MILNLFCQWQMHFSFSAIFNIFSFNFRSLIGVRCSWTERASRVCKLGSQASQSAVQPSLKPTSWRSPAVGGVQPRGTFPLPQSQWGDGGSAPKAECTIPHQGDWEYPAQQLVRASSMSTRPSPSGSRSSSFCPPPENGFWKGQWREGVASSWFGHRRFDPSRESLRKPCP